MNNTQASLQHPADQVVETMTRIYRAGLTTTSGGNVSARDAEGNIWITPAAVDKGGLQRDDIVCMAGDGTNGSGFRRPSSEYPFHRAIYTARPDLAAIIHAHPPALVAFSTVRKPPNMNISPLARKVCGKIGYAAYACPGSEALGERISEQFSKGCDAVIMENHGAVVAGRNISDAFTRFETFEFSARAIINASIIGKPVYLGDEQIGKYESLTVADLPEMVQTDQAQSEDLVRGDITSIVQRACAQGMMISAYGVVSVRGQGEDFLITPRDVDRGAMGVGDIVQIRDGRREKGKWPSREVGLHQAIYRHNPQVNSIISTQPPHLMAFAVARKKIDVRTIPESWIFLQDIPTMPFGAQYTQMEEIVRSFGPDRPAMLFENDRLIVTGDKLLETFDRLEVAELSARALVMGHTLGELAPIDVTQVEELRRVFC